MNADTAILWIDRLVALETHKHLNDLQIFLLQQVWLGKKYTEIAEDYHCTEGHLMVPHSFIVLPQADRFIKQGNSCTIHC